MKKALNLLNDLDTDFKATVKVAELFENGDFERDQVTILPVGARQSAYAKDINGFSSYYSEGMMKDCFIVEVNREGLYDMLPEGLFHVTPMRSSSLSDLEMMADVQLRRNEERDARKFFMPFEAELNYMRTLLEWYENRLDKKTSYNDLSLIFGAEWKEFEYLDNDQRIIWMHLLPVIQQKRNDTCFLSELLSVLFNIPVRVILNPSAITAMPIDESMQFKMGRGALGIETVIGADFLSGREEVYIHIGPAEGVKLIRFLPGTPYAHLIDTVVSYLMPVETAIKVELLSKPENKIGALGADSSNSFLGFTLYL
jgi:type VI secretion system protein ImpH